ncbi:myosin-binding protein H isoform X1 [Gopherus flavomarginatus]|uniref:myosin-binding protein H isoform X1 n=1 Tax=Gopherus flavomarginatus TaxID=286002 RepID=UPI0021CBAB3F|nr:myosin-binding protein H isoform X1 [Gopherus flavomarginatus]
MPGKEPDPDPQLAQATPAAEPAEAPAAEAAPASPAEGALQPEPQVPAAAPERGEPKAEPPSCPLHLAVEDVNDNSVSLTWKAPEQEGSTDLDGYLVECCKDGTADWVAANKELILSTRYTIRNLISGDRLQIRVKAVNAGGMSVPAVLEQPVVIREILEHPKIRVPRHLRQTYIRPAGEVVNLLIPFQGKPRPQVSWSKDGQPLDPKRVTVRNGDRDTIFFIRKAERSDSGQYQLSVKIDRLEDKATIDIRVIEQPGPPENLKLVDVWGFNVALEWSPPKDNGNTALKGYTVQKSDRKSGQWFTVLERCPRPSCTVSDLIIGNSYSFRVFSENACGYSATAAVTTELAHIRKPEIAYKPEKYSGRDFSEPPKFTQPLADRSTTRGYNTQLFCCVRAFPKPKIIWLKNQTEIREDPKYIAVINEGVCSLEIRKPSPFDGGVYTCKAVNPLGEASVDCRLDVKEYPSEGRVAGLMKKKVGWHLAGAIIRPVGAGASVPKDPDTGATF